MCGPFVEENDAGLPVRRASDHHALTLPPRKSGTHVTHQCQVLHRQLLNLVMDTRQSGRRFHTFEVNVLRVDGDVLDKVSGEQIVILHDHAKFPSVVLHVEIRDAGHRLEPYPPAALVGGRAA